MTTKVARARWYPDMPPMLPGETVATYTDRLTGADAKDRQPYDHRRNRQCSIGYHGECSDPLGKQCECPCHKAPKVARGFALLTPAQRRVVSSMGGSSAHAAGTAHQWDRREAMAAGSKGGKAAAAKRAARGA